MYVSMHDAGGMYSSQHICVLLDVKADCQQLDKTSIQLVLAVELMAASVDISYSQIPPGHVASAAIVEIHRNMFQLVKELAKDLEIFWQVNLIACSIY